MPKAGYCKECKKNVWLRADGFCQHGHPPGDISNVYETDQAVRKNSNEVSPKEKKALSTDKKALLVLLAAVSILILCAAIGALSTINDKPEVTKTKSTSTTPAKENMEIKLDISSPTSGQAIAASSVEVVGSTEDNATIIINEAQVTVDPNTATFKHSVNLQEGPNTITILARKEGFKSKETTLTVTREVSETEFKGACQMIPYKQLDRDADQLKGTKVYYHGKIFNINTSESLANIQLNVTDIGYGIWDDQVFVVYSGSIDVYEDDMIDMWGTVYGKYSYESQAGWQITVQRVEAKYLSK